MTDHATATEPTTTSAADTVPAGLYSEHVNLMVDVETRAFLLGRAVLAARAAGYRFPREAATIRAAFDTILDEARAADPKAYARAVKAGRQELKERAEAKRARQLRGGTRVRDAIALGRERAHQG